MIIRTIPTLMMKWQWLGMVLIGFLAPSTAMAACNPVDFNQMSTYADNAIHGAVLDGRSRVTITFGNADMDLIEKLGDSLQAKGYTIDQQAWLLNPMVLKLFNLPKRVTLAREGNQPVIQSPTVEVVKIPETELDAAVIGE